MGFGKKNKANNEVTNDTAQNDTSKKSKKRKKDGLHLYFRESVFETIAVDLENNAYCSMEVDGEKSYIALLLDVNDIGGIDKKSKNDLSKGQIIEMINSGKIKTYNTEATLDDNVLIIIPDLETLDKMDEFQALVDAPYTLCVIDESGKITVEDVKTTYTQISDMAVNDISVSSLLNTDSNAESETESETNVESDTTSDVNNSNEEQSVSSDETNSPVTENTTDSIISEEPDMVEEPPQDFVEEPDFSGQDAMYEEDMGYAQDEDDFQPDMTAFNQSDAGDMGYAENQDDVYQGSDAETVSTQEPQVEQTEEMVDTFISRKLYSDDLRLEISTEPFDLQFMHGNSYLPFDTNRPDDWLNSQLNEMSRQANARMARMHQQNLFKLRERYVKLLEIHCNRIQQELDDTNADTQMGQLANLIRDEKVKKQQEIDRSIAEKKAELEEQWEKKLNQIADDAARSARQQYRDQYGAQHEEELYMLEPNMKDQLELDYQNAVRELHEKRRAEASKMLDLGINDILIEISEMYKHILDTEDKEYARLAEDIMAFIDEHRKDEKARIDVLAEQNRLNNEAERVRNEYAAKLESDKAEFQARNDALALDIENLKRENDVMMRSKQLEWDNKLQIEKDKNAELTRQMDELLKRYSELDEKKAREFESRINELTQERQSWEDKTNHIVNINKKSTSIMTFVIVVMTLAGLAIGFIAGEFVNIKQSTNAQIDQLRYEMEYNRTHDGDAQESESTNDTTSKAKTTEKSTSASKSK